jgi:Ca2+/H+ antiporter
MRTIGFRSNVLFIVASAFGLLAALGRPWYAPAPVPTAEEANIGDVQGPVESFFLRLGREFGNDGGTTGWNAFTSTDLILVALVVIAVVTAIGALTPGIEQPAREVLRIATLAMLGIVVVKLVNTPDGVGLVERRQGAWIALGVTGIMASSASTLYHAPLARRKRGPSLYDSPVVPPPRSTVFDAPGSSSPPGEPS